MSYLGIFRFNKIWQFMTTTKAHLGNLSQLQSSSLGQSPYCLEVMSFLLFSWCLTVLILFVVFLSSPKTLASLPRYLFVMINLQQQYQLLHYLLACSCLSTTRFFPSLLGFCSGVLELGRVYVST